MKPNFIDSQQACSPARSSGSRSGANYRDGATVEAFTWSLIAADRHDRDRDARRDVVICRRRRAATSASRARNDQYDTDEWILIDLRASAAFRRAGQRAEGGPAARLGHRAGVGELQPPARALQHAHVERSDRRVLGLDPDGRLRRRRVPADDARPRAALRAQRLRREGPRRVSRRGPRAADGGGAGTGGNGFGGAPASRARVRAVRLGRATPVVFAARRALLVMRRRRR